MNFHHCHMAQYGLGRVYETLNSASLSQGEKVKEFEGLLQRDLGLSNPVTVNSGTTAIQLALTLAGVGPGDEVILPAQTFVATGMAILAVGAKPVFADIEASTGNIEPLDAAKRITHKTKAIIPVHWAGLPCHLNVLSSLVASSRLTVIEDAAHALGATYAGQPIGAHTWIRFTCFSFQAVKHLTTGDGGALCCRDEDDYQGAKRTRWFGIDRDEPFGPLGEREWLIGQPGYKWHMNDVAASIGLGNLVGLKDRLARRRRICAEYQEAFSGKAGIRLLSLCTNRESAYWIFSMLVDERDRFAAAMTARGIPVSVVNRRIDRHPVFGGLRKYLRGQEEFERRHIALPCHPGLTDDDVGRVIRAVQEGW